MYSHKQNVAKNMNGKSLLVFGRSSKGNEKHAIGNGRKGDPCHVEVENLPELCLLLLGKAKLISDELRCLTETVSSQQLRYSLVYYCCVW